MAYNTGNPIGSLDPRDAADNKENFDRFAVSASRTYTDRLGVERKTVAGTLQDYAAYNQRGEWTTATAYNVNDVWRDGPTGAFYLVLADYTSGATAAADIAGGNVRIFAGIQATDAQMKSGTANVFADAELVRRNHVAQVATISDLRALEPAFDGQQIELLGHTVAGIGGGIFYADYSDTASPDNNGTVIVTPGGRRWKRKLTHGLFLEHFGLLQSASAASNTTAIESAIQHLRTIGGGEVCFGFGDFDFNGIALNSPDKNIRICGMGWGSRLINKAAGAAIRATGPSFDDPVLGLTFDNFRLSGDGASTVGFQLDKLGRFGEDTNVTVIDHVWVDGHTESGIQFGQTTSSGAGNILVVSNSKVESNRDGIITIGQSNLLQATGNTISNNTRDGILLNQVASTCRIEGNAIFDNARFGLQTFRAEQPIIKSNGFNRNSRGAVVINGDPVGSGSVKYTEAALILGNLFGDNGGGSAAGSRTEISLRACQGTMIYDNYFYETGKDRYVYIADYVEGAIIKSNHYKDFTSADESKRVVVKSPGTNQHVIFDDDIRVDNFQNVHQLGKVLQYIAGASSTLMQVRNLISDSAPRFRITGSGAMEWSSGSAASDVNLSRTGSGTLGVLAADGTTANNLGCGRLELQNDRGATAKTGVARVYMDTDGALKAINSSGVVRTLTTFT